MTKERILAEAMLHIETVREIDINRHISTAITQFNELGLRRLLTVTVASTNKDDPGDPAERTQTERNYYPPQRALVLPESVIHAYGVYQNKVKLALCSIEDILQGNCFGKAYAFFEHNELRLSYELNDGDQIVIDGRIAIRNINLLPDSCENWLLNHVLAGLYSMPLYFNGNLFALYDSRRLMAWKKVRSMRQQLPSWTSRGDEGW